MKVRFQADADLNAEIVAGVLRREPSIDFQTADEANLRRFPDPEVLARFRRSRFNVNVPVGVRG